MKNLLLVGLLAVPTALVACNSTDQSSVAPAETSVVQLNVSGMT